LREIARCLGLSHVTVSLALRDSSRVSASTKERIKKAANDMGYRPDPMLTALAAYRSSKSPAAIHSVVAWINAWEDPEELRGYKEFDLYWKGSSDFLSRGGTDVGAGTRYRSSALLNR
jgi:LacI family transcriptional regulator